MKTYEKIPAGTARRLTVLENSAESCAGEFLPDADFSGFQGHFPGRPILPGVCIITAAQELIQLARGREYELAGLNRVKFFRPSMPGEKLIFRSRLTADEPGKIRADTQVTDEAGNKVSSLILHLEEKP